MPNCRIIRGVVGRYAYGAVVDAAWFGGGIQRLLDLGVIAMTDAPVTVTESGDPLPEVPAIQEPPSPEPPRDKPRRK